MTIFSSTQLKKCVALVGILFLLAESHIALADEMTQELECFVKAYKVAESGEISLRISIQIVTNESKVNGAFVECIKSKLTPSVYEDAALDVARQQFENLDNLKTINAFLESAVGKKLTDQTLAWRASNLKRILDGLKPLPPHATQYTAEELRDIHAWEKTPAYSDFISFIKNGLRNLESHDKARKSFLQLRNQCTNKPAVPIQ